MLIEAPILGAETRAEQGSSRHCFEAPSLHFASYVAGAGLMARQGAAMNDPETKAPLEHSARM
jgi:hypothetical protein